MADDVVDYSGTSDSDSERDKVPSRLPAPAGSCIFAHELSLLHAGCGCPPSPEKNSIAVCAAIPSDPFFWKAYLSIEFTLNGSRPS